MADQPQTEGTELVITYLIHATGKYAEENTEYKRLQKALREGYRVLDVIQTAVNGGGAANGNGQTCITVVLEKEDLPSSNRYKRFNKPG